jgi:hypothetical protein
MDRGLIARYSAAWVTLSRWLEWRCFCLVRGFIMCSARRGYGTRGTGAFRYCEKGAIRPAITMACSGTPEPQLPNWEGRCVCNPDVHM